MMWKSAISYLSLAVGLSGFGVFAWTRLRSYLHVFQQDEYETPRFVRWIVRTASFDRTASLVALGAWAVTLASRHSLDLFTNSFVGVTLIAIAVREQRHLQQAKKPLVMTSRALRIIQLAWLCSMILAVAGMLLGTGAWIWVAVIQMCPVVLIAANFALTPFERGVKRKYWREAHTKLARLAPLIIGITGSYGKTSTKHILGHILQFHQQTLITPGSVNTAMGIARIVREQLRPSHKYFVVEMGAYGPGSIRSLCELAPPNLGILTAIGSAHLERFGSRDATARAKLELASSVFSNSGKMIINGDLVSIPAVGEQLALNRGRFVVCGPGGDLTVEDVVQTKSGLHLQIRAEGESFNVVTPLFGLHQATNIALAFAASRSVGVPTKVILSALRTVPQTAHRLEVRNESGFLLIDDSYNSNPQGFQSALDLLGVLRTEGGTTYLITPGIVELGSDHDGEHRRLGVLAGQSADVIYVVGPDRIPTFLSGVTAAKGPSGRVETFKTFLAAQERLRSQVRPGDVVLIENDLPDLYERRMLL